MNNLWWIYLFIFILLFYGLNVKKSQSFFDDYLSLETMKYLQGFAVIGVIIHHLVQKLTNFGQTDSILGIFNYLGVNFVGIFLFCSGYGLYKSFKTKENYLTHFFKKRFPTILIPFYLISILYFAMNVFSGANYTWKEATISLLGFRLVNGDFWFVIAILIFYSIFYLCFKFIKKEWLAILILTISMFTYIVICILRVNGNGTSWLQGEWWCNSAVLFLVGILWAKLEPTLILFIKKFYWAILPITMILYLSLQKLSNTVIGKIGYWSETPDDPAYLAKFQCLGIQSLSIIAFVLFIIILNMKVKFKNSALKYIGALTLEIYLLQRFFIIQFEPLQTNYVMYTIAVICTTILAASGVHQLSVFLKKKFFMV